MKIKQARFISSSVKTEQCPKTFLPEYAFIGRSNVGKSSLINYLCGNASLAKVSVKPGKTQTINHFQVEDGDKGWFLVDLPGYGYAKRSKEERKKWASFIEDYFRNRKNLNCVFVLIDSRLEPQAIDLEFLNMLGEMMLPVVLIYTKTDKQSQNMTRKHIAQFERQMLNAWESVPPGIATSVVEKKGKEEILNLIANYNREYFASNP